MSTVRAIHDPAELALYSLREGDWAWLIEPDATELTARGVDAALYGVTVVGVEGWPTDPDVVEVVAYPAAHPVGLPGLVPLDVRYLSVRLLATPAELVWSAPVGVSPRLDLLRIEGLKKAQVVGLYQARRLVDLDWGPLLGRPLGDTDLSPEEFERKLAVAVAVMRRLKVPLNQEALALEIGLNATTLRKYLDIAGVNWWSVRKGDWPPAK